ncbi:MAG: PKD domain-containing protein [Thermoplasmatales archaeon]|nr:PKD domain-containing protein [Thermoplasmatales archaeon]
MYGVYKYGDFKKENNLMKKLKLVGVGLTVIVVIGVIIAVSYIWASPFTWGWAVGADAGGDKIVHVNETVFFNGSGSYAVSGCMGGAHHKILLVWDFDESDGVNGDAVGINVSHKYTEVGNYTVTLIVILMEDIKAPSGHQDVKKGQMDEDKVNVTVLH